MTSIPPKVLASHFDELIRAMPERAALGRDSEESTQWLAMASALVRMADPVRAVDFQYNVKQIAHLGSSFNSVNVRNVVTTVLQFRIEANLLGGGPVTTVFDAAKPFDYFDEVRRVISLATTDILFADPYLNADFIARYMPYVRAGVQVRLLTGKGMPELKVAADLFAKQSGLHIEVRQPITKHHDRYLFIDRRECWQSGASFKDGGVNAPTTLTQFVDAFAEVHKVYEEKWMHGRTA